MAELVNALNTISGQVAEVDASAFEGPFAEILVAVPAGTKSYNPIKYKAKTRDEWLAANPQGIPEEIDGTPVEQDTEPVDLLALQPIPIEPVVAPEETGK